MKLQVVSKMVNRKYSPTECAWIVRRRYEDKLSYDRIRDYFAAIFPWRPIPGKATVKQIIDRFNNGVLDPSLKKVKQPNRALPLDLQMDICQTVVDNPKTSLSEISKLYDVSTSAACRLLHRENFYPYKVSCHQQLFAEDATRRKAFCEEMQNMLDMDEDLLKTLFLAMMYISHRSRS